MVLDKNTFENIVGKEEYAGIQHFLLFTQCFLPIPKRISNSNLYLFCRQQMLWIWTCLNPIQTTNFDYSKPKEFADDNFELDENGRKFAKWVENTVGKGEIACYQQFLLFPQFSKDFTADT